MPPAEGGLSGFPFLDPGKQPQRDRGRRYLSELRAEGHEGRTGNERGCLVSTQPVTPLVVLCGSFEMVNPVGGCEEAKPRRACRGFALRPYRDGERPDAGVHRSSLIVSAYSPLNASNSARIWRT
jgi:hypothetical protein